MFNFLDLLYPLDLAHLFDQGAISSFSKKVTDSDLETIWIAFNFDNSHVNELINRSKNLNEFGLSKQLGQELCHLMVRFWQILLSRKDLVQTPVEHRILNLFQDIFNPQTKVLFTYVPPDPTRKLVIGFHLPELITQSLITNLKLESNGQKQFQYHKTLFKPKTTPKQTGLSKQKRQENLKVKSYSALI